MANILEVAEGNEVAEFCNGEFWLIGEYTGAEGGCLPFGFFEISYPSATLGNTQVVLLEQGRQFKI